MATKFGKQVQLEELIQMKLIKQALVTPSRQDHVTSWKHMSAKKASMATKLGRMVT